MSTVPPFFAISHVPCTSTYIYIFILGRIINIPLLVKYFSSTIYICIYSKYIYYTQNTQQSLCTTTSENIAACQYKAPYIIPIYVYILNIHRTQGKYNEKMLNKCLCILYIFIYIV